MIPPFVAARFASTALKWAGDNWKLLALGAVALAGAFLYWQWDRASDRADKWEATAKQERADKEQAQATITVLETAAIERARDGVALDSMKKDYRDAIEAVQAGGAPSDAAVALGCARLRKANRTDASEYQAVCAGR